MSPPCSGCFHVLVGGCRYRVPHLPLAVLCLVGLSAGALRVSVVWGNLVCMVWLPWPCLLCLGLHCCVYCLVYVFIEWVLRCSLLLRCLVFPLSGRAPLFFMSGVLYACAKCLVALLVPQYVYAVSQSLVGLLIAGVGLRVKSCSRASVSWV